MASLTQTQKLIIIGLLAWLLFFGAPGGASDKPTAATYVMEKDKGSVPPPVAAALDKLNDGGITATVLEVDTTDADGKIPEQYKNTQPAAVKAGLPVLIFSAAGDRVLTGRTVLNPTTEEQVLEAAK